MQEGGSVTAPAATPAPKSAETTPVESVETQGENQQQSTPQDDPEIDFGDFKVKRSEAAQALKKRKELDRGAYEKFQQASQMRKEAEQRESQVRELLGALGKDAKSALKHAGLDPVKVAEQILSEALAEHQLTPDQREARQARAELDKLKAEKAEIEGEKQRTAYAAEVSKWEQHYETQAINAIKASHLPATPAVLARIAAKAEAYVDAGIEVSMEDVAHEVKSDLIAELRSVRTGIADDQIDEFYDKEELERLRKRFIKQVSGQQQQQPKAETTYGRTQKGKPLTRAEFEERLRKRIGA
jgi:hypothetical protein